MTMKPDQVPMLWTSRGNLPISQLRYEEQWINNGEILALQRFYFDTDGVLVSNSFHGYLLTPSLWTKVKRWVKSRNLKQVILNGQSVAATPGSV